MALRTAMVDLAAMADVALATNKTFRFFWPGVSWAFFISRNHLFKKICYTNGAMYDVIVIGAGVVGSFIARNLARYRLKTLVLEKDLDAADEATMANSAIVHSGYDPVPGTLKAKMNVLGNRMMPKICGELDVPFEKCGTLTLSFSLEENEKLKMLQKRAQENGVKSVIWNEKELHEKEPNVSKEAIAALFCEDGGIVNPFLLSLHALENALDNGVSLHLGEKVIGLNKEGVGYAIQTDKALYQAKLVINAAGTHSDEIAKMAGPISWKIEPRKGEYFVLNHYAKGLVNSVLFTLPTEKGKGVLITKTSSGNYLVGPSSEPDNDPDDLSTDSFTLSKVKEMALRMVPSIPFYESIRVYSGMRATPSTHDFILGPQNGDPSFINAAGIESPGLASSPAIGKYVVDSFVVSYLKPQENPSYNPVVKPYVCPKKLAKKERNELIEKNPDYGKILCDCEEVSLGEMKDVLSRSLPCLTVKGMKKRTRAGFGKCQGGFCQAKVLALLAECQGVPLDKVNYGKPHSPILLGKAKKGASK